MEEDLVNPVPTSDEEDEDWMNLDDNQEDNTSSKAEASTSKAGKSDKSGKAEIEIQPGFDQSENKKAEGEGWRRGRVRFGKVKLDKYFIKFLPRHARLQKMTYSSKIKVEIDVMVYTPMNESGGKFKTGTETKHTLKVQSHDKVEILGEVEALLDELGERGVCEFDQGGYFLIEFEGAEKVFIAHERICLKRLWISDQPNLTIAYRTEIRRQMIKVGIEDVPPELKHLEGTKIRNVYFLYCRIPLWVFLYALGMSSDRDINSSDTGAVNLSHPWAMLTAILKVSAEANLLKKLRKWSAK